MICAEPALRPIPEIVLKGSREPLGADIVPSVDHIV